MKRASPPLWFVVALAVAAGGGILAMVATAVSHTAPGSDSPGEAPAPRARPALPTAHAAAKATGATAPQQTRFFPGSQSRFSRRSRQRPVWDLGPVQKEFYFTRAAYNGYSLRGFGNSWSVDYPKADVQFLIGLQRLVNHLDAYEDEHPILLTNPQLGEYPFLYAVEVGYMSLSEAEVEGLRRYLLAGGFLVVDDFWGTHEWANFESEIGRVLPGYPIVDLSLDHPIFHCFYDVKEIVQVPNVGQGRAGGPTWERDGYWPAVKGILDVDGRLLVVINWNSDLGDAWEWAEDPYYPLNFSTYAYQMGVNFIIYAMSH